VGPKIGWLFLLAANAALGQTPLTLQVNVEPASIALSNGGFSLSFTAYPSAAPAITPIAVAGGLSLQGATAATGGDNGSLSKPMPPLFCNSRTQAPRLLR